MREYTPDVWAVVEIKQCDEVITKILAGWHSGNTNGDSWKLSSGIESIDEIFDIYIMPNSSGSLYKCHKNNYGTSIITANIFKNLKNILGNDIRLLEIEEIYATPMEKIDE